MTGSPFDLELLVMIPGTVQAERNIHRTFASSRKRLEWFDPHRDLRAGIRALKSGASIDEAFGFHQQTPMKRLRDRMGWSQRQLAEFLGVEQATVSRIERGEWEPSGPVLKLLGLLAGPPQDRVLRQAG